MWKSKYSAIMWMLIHTLRAKRAEIAAVNFIFRQSRALGTEIAIIRGTGGEMVQMEQWGLGLINADG